MMGGKKSTIADYYKKLDSFIDIDKVIEKQEKINKKIFEMKGEAYFRRLEEKITIKYLKNNISFRIGWWCFQINRKRFKIFSGIRLNLKLDLLIKSNNRNNNNLF